MSEHPEFHLYLYEVPSAYPFVHSYEKVEKKIARHEHVHTTQLCFCDGNLFSKGYRIFVHPRAREKHEITLSDCEGTNREIRPSHRLWHMIITGVFDWYNEEEK